MADPLSNPDVPSNKKRFIPLGLPVLPLHVHTAPDPITENNPEVMSSLLHQLGLSKALSFSDVYSINDPDLLAFVPRPTYALLLVFPVSPTYEKFRLQEDTGKPEYGGSGPDEEVIWFKQTIGNACGLIGLLHAAVNGPSRTLIGVWCHSFSSQTPPRNMTTSRRKQSPYVLIQAHHPQPQTQNQTCSTSSTKPSPSSPPREPISSTSLAPSNPRTKPPPRKATRAPRRQKRTLICTTYASSRRRRAICGSWMDGGSDR